MIYKTYQTETTGYRTNIPEPDWEQSAMEAFLKAAFYAGVGLGILVGKALVDFLNGNR